METNSVITNRLNINGNGFSRTYEESIIRRARNLDFGNAYKGQLFLNLENGKIHWATTEDEYKHLLNQPGEYKKVKLINIQLIDQTSAFIEVIDPTILKMHLLEEKEQQKQLLNKTNELIEKLNSLTNNGQNQLSLQK